MNITTSRYYLHLLRFQHMYAPIVTMFLVGFMYFFHSLHGQPLNIGPESYFHLSSFPQQGWANYFPVGLLLALIPATMLFLIPLVLSVGSIILLVVLASRLKWDLETRFLFFLFVLLTPAFVYAASTISAAMIGLFFIVLGLVLLTYPKAKYLAALPFLILPFIDLGTGILALLLLMVHMYHHQKEKWIIGMIGAMIVCLLINGLFVQEPFVTGPFHEQRIIADMVSDLGGHSGIGFTLLLLAVLGMGMAWRSPHYRWWYLVVLILIPMYMYNTQVILYLAVTLLLFASVGYKKLFSTIWNQKTLKLFTMLVIILSICFSAVSYIQRMPAIGPSADDVAALTWMKDNLPEDKKVLALPQEGYYIYYFSEHVPLIEPHIQEDTLLLTTLLNSSYIATTFPILEQENVGAIYVTPAFKAAYPADQGGLLFLLKNERFKLAYSSGEYEVWVFR